MGKLGKFGEDIILKCEHILVNKTSATRLSVSPILLHLLWHLKTVLFYVAPDLSIIVKSQNISRLHLSHLPANNLEQNGGNEALGII
jgi:hypothetical protein